MPPISTSEARRLWAPGCQDANGVAAEVMWSALDDWFLEFGYIVRPEVTSAANCRPITGGKGLSIHAFYDRRRRYSFRSVAPGRPCRIAVAAAVDVNSDKNPYGPRPITDMPGEMVRRILAMRTRNGKQVATWGGLWRPSDAMHYQAGCGPRDLLTGIDPRTLPTSQPPPEPEPEEPEMKHYLFAIIPDRIGELPPSMRDAASLGAWLYTDGDVWWWCPTEGHAKRQFEQGLAQSPTPQSFESPSYLKELRPRSQADLDPAGILYPDREGRRCFFVNDAGDVHPAVWDR